MGTRTKSQSNGRRPRRNRAEARIHFPFWAGWVALTAGGATFYLVITPALWLSTGQGATYQCWRNAYDCSDFDLWRPPETMCTASTMTGTA